LGFDLPLLQRRASVHYIAAAVMAFWTGSSEWTRCHPNAVAMGIRCVSKARAQHASTCSLGFLRDSDNAVV